MTGGNGGIGFGIARRLADAGADIAVVRRNEAKSKAAADQLAARGANAIAAVADKAAVAGNGRTRQARTRRIDILVSNAGINRKPSARP